MGAPEAQRGPLAALAETLRGMAGPPRLSALIDQLGDAELYQGFVDLVRDYLPDLEQDILQAGVLAQMVAAFARAFGERYFPLHGSFEAGMAEGFYDLLSHIPVEVHGWEDDDYHEIPGMRAGLILASLLVDFEGALGLGGEGIRITAMEAAAKLVPLELVQRTTAYPLDLLRVVLPGSRNAGLLALAQAMCHDTGNFFLDVTYEEFPYYEAPEWDRETVEALTEQWREADEAEKRTGEFIEWLEASPGPNFTELVDFLERRADGRAEVGAAGRDAATA